MSSSRSAVASALTLRDFIHRSKVLTQYRVFMRETVGLDSHVRKELRDQIRNEFKSKANETNRANMKAHLMEGERQLQFLRIYRGTAKQVPNQGEEQTWVGTVDADDIKGRIGTGWPWNDETVQK